LPALSNTALFSGVDTVFSAVCAVYPTTKVQDFVLQGGNASISPVPPFKNLRLLRLHSRINSGTEWDRKHKVRIKDWVGPGNCAVAGSACVTSIKNPCTGKCSKFNNSCMRAKALMIHDFQKVNLGHFNTTKKTCNCSYGEIY